MEESVKIELTGRIDGKIATSIRDIARAAIEADSSLDLLRQALREVSSGAALKSIASDARTIRNEIRQTQGAVNALGGAVNGVANDFDRAAGSARKFNDEARKGAASVNGVKTAASGLRSSLAPLVGTFSAIFAVGQYIRAQDALTNMQNQIRSLTADVERQIAIQDALFEMANRTRSGIESTTGAFVRFSKAMQGASDPEVLRFVETLNKALITAGRTSAEVSSIVTQLGQALTSGRLMGDEFRSLSENLPREALQAIADQLDVDVSKLKELSSQGVITTDVLRKAFAGMADQIDEAFARSVPTIGQALTVLNNQFIKFTDDTTGAAGFLADAIIAVADNLNIVIPVIAAFGAAWALVGIANIITQFASLTAALIAMLPVIAANAVAVAVAVAPWIALAAAVALVAGGILLATGQWDNFVSWIDEALRPVTEMAEKVGLLGGELAKGAAPADALASSFGGVTTEARSAGSAMTEMGDKTAAASNKMVKANQAAVDSFWRLFHAAKAASSAANDSNYQKLQQAGGTVGSFTAVPSAPAAGSSGSSIVTLPKMKEGGSMMVGGTSRGVDRNLVAFRANRGERVDVLTKAQQRRENRQNNAGNNAPVFNFNITTPDADSFRLSRNQIASDTFAALG
jgi:tape measure domain-containing protein